MDPALDVIARLARVEPEALKPELTLGKLGLHTSLGLGILQSALERQFKRKLGPFRWNTTIAQVLEAVGLEAVTEVGRRVPATPSDSAKPGAGGTHRPTSESKGVGGTRSTTEGVAGTRRPTSGPFGGRTHFQAPGAFPSIGHGVDIQEIAAMPEPHGERTADPFYTSHFTASELAGAALRTDAKAHLCGLWCAKEAIRKSEPDLAKLPFLEIAIEHDQNGAPRARLGEGGPARFEISLSISHSAAYAVASAITLRR